MIVLATAKGVRCMTATASRSARIPVPPTTSDHLILQAPIHASPPGSSRVYHGASIIARTNSRRRADRTYGARGNGGRHPNLLSHCVVGKKHTHTVNVSQIRWTSPDHRCSHLTRDRRDHSVPCVRDQAEALAEHRAGRGVCAVALELIVPCLSVHLRSRSSGQA